MWATKLALLALLLVVSSAHARDCGEKPFYGITYAPFALNLTTICLPVKQVEEDMKMIASLAHSVRIYNIHICYDSTVTIMESAKKYNMTVMMGLWMSQDADAFEGEFAALPYFMENYAEIIEYVIVGNEPVFIEEVNITTVLDNYRRVREWLRENDYPHLTSVAEVWPFLEQKEGHSFVAELDFVCMNMQPYWEGFNAICPGDRFSSESRFSKRPEFSKRPGFSSRQCTPASLYIHQKALGLQRFFGKPVMLCESGWPTAGEPCCSGGRDFSVQGNRAIPSTLNARSFIRDFVDISRQRHVKHWVHAFVDEDWKKIWAPCDACKGRQVAKTEDGDCTVGCQVDYSWGLYSYKNRVHKQNYGMPTPMNMCDFTMTSYSDL